MTIKVLTVDDEPDVRRLVQIKLKKAGYEVLTATNGEEGVKVAVKEKPDIVLLDVKMPRMNGFEALEQIKARMDPAPIVIMLTGEGETEDLMQGLGTGADDYIVKPFAPRELLARVKLAVVRSGSARKPDTSEDESEKLDPEAQAAASTPTEETASENTANTAKQEGQAEADSPAAVDETQAQG